MLDILVDHIRIDRQAISDLRLDQRRQPLGRLVRIRRCELVISAPDRSIYMNFLDGAGIGAAKPIGGSSDEVFVLRNEADPARQREQRSSRTDFGLESTGSPERAIGGRRGTADRLDESSIELKAQRYCRQFVSCYPKIGHLLTEPDRARL